MQAAGASSEQPHNTARHSEGPTGTDASAEGGSGAELAPALPHWDCNDANTWHKRQQVSLHGHNAVTLYYILCQPFTLLLHYRHAMPTS